MYKSGLKLAATALAIALAASMVTADAATKDKKKKKSGFFSELFGEPRAKKRERKSKSLFSKRWWDDDGDARVLNNPESEITRRPSPESDPGYGTGNLTYVPDKLVALGGMAAATAAAPGPMEGAVQAALADPDLGLRVLPEARDAILEQYKSQGFRPLWIDNGQVSPRGQALLKLLAESGAEGLDPADYLPPTLSAYDMPVASSPAALARFDLGLTAMAVKYARDSSGGKFDPRRLSRYHDVTPEWVKASKAIKVLAWSPYPVEYLQSLYPTHPAYGAFRTALAELALAPDVPVVEPIPGGPIIKLGKSDGRLPMVRERLAAKGYGPEPEYIVEDPLVLDAELSARLKAFQKDTGIKTSGLVGPQTIGALNGEKRIDRRHVLIDNMERLRWLPRNLGARYVFVNQAAFEVRVMNGGVEEWRSRVIVGKPDTQTAVFHDEMETVVFNPSWGVPQSIIRNEYLPKLRDDPGYLDRLGFNVVNAKGRVISSYDVDWWSYDSSIGIQQPPGSDNALGEIKFLFPNSHDIYMHDTPNRELFEEDVRAFSHGCVRVQNPREFASILLGWDASRVAENIERGDSQSVRLPAKVPVHITYFTAWPDGAGKINYFNDIYERDQTMDRARSALTVAAR